MEVTKPQVLKICEKLKRDLISFSFLARGAHNENYLIKTKQDHLVLRIENNLQFKNLKKEYQLLKKTEGKLGPKVFLFDNSKKIISRDFIVEEYIEGDHPKKATKDFIITMANWYRELHKIKTSKLPKSLAINGKYSFLKSSQHYYLNSYKKNRKMIDVKLRKTLDEIFEKAENIAKENDRLYFRQKYFSLVHGDPTPGNIFYSLGKVKLIDWEFSEFGLLAEWDLAFFIRKYKLNKQKEKLFLETYNFPKKKQYKIKLLLVKLRLVLMTLKWLVERLNLSYQNKIDPNLYASSKQEIIKEIYEGIPEAEKLLKLVNLGS